MATADDDHETHLEIARRYWPKVQEAQREMSKLEQINAPDQDDADEFPDETAELERLARCQFLADLKAFIDCPHRRRQVEMVLADARRTDPRCESRG